MTLFSYSVTSREQDLSSGTFLTKVFFSIIFRDSIGFLPEGTGTAFNNPVSCGSSPLSPSPQGG